jgi:hypothetical protein
MLELFKVIKTKRKEMIIFASFMLTTIALIIAYTLFPIPSPTDIIGTLLHPLVKPIQLWIKGGS